MSASTAGQQSYRPWMAWLATAAIVTVLLSPLVTYQAAIEVAAQASREYSVSGMGTAGYIARELAYVTLAVLGVAVISRLRHGLAVLCATAAYLLVLVIKDVAIYGSMEWAIYGIRPIIIGLSFPVMRILYSQRSLRQIKTLIFITKALIVFLVPVTMFQLATLPPLFGATFLGPRTMGFWPNPILYSMAMAGLGLFLLVAGARRAAIWILICLGLALTTGGRAGLLALALVSVVLALRTLGVFTVQQRALPVLYLAAIALSVIMTPQLFELLSSSEISGRVGTEMSGLNDGRISLIAAAINSVVSQGVWAVLFGGRLGYGTNAIATIAGQSMAVSDNLLLMIFRSYGLTGVLLFGALLLSWLKRISLRRPISVAVLAGMAPMAAAQSVIEIHPVGLLLLMSAAIATIKSDQGVPGTVVDSRYAPARKMTSRNRKSLRHSSSGALG